MTCFWGIKPYVGLSAQIVRAFRSEMPQQLRHKAADGVRDARRAIWDDKHDAAVVRSQCGRDLLSRLQPRWRGGSSPERVDPLLLPQRQAAKAEGVGTGAGRAGIGKAQDGHQNAPPQRCGTLVPPRFRQSFVVPPPVFLNRIPAICSPCQVSIARILSLSTDSCTGLVRWRGNTAEEHPHNYLVCR